MTNVPTPAVTATIGWFSVFEDKLETAAKKFEVKIETDAKKIEPIVVQYSESFLEALAEIAIGAVLKQVPLVMLGTEKASSAVTDVIQQVEAKGQTIGEADAAAAVQAAYNKVVTKANS